MSKSCEATGSEKSPMSLPGPRKVLVVASSALAMVVGIGLTPASRAQSRIALPNLAGFPNSAGVSRTFSTEGGIDTTSPFFQSLGTNGRACVTCHDPSTGWSITPAFVQARFAATGGLDPLFRANDGSNSPDGDMSTPAARHHACSMLLKK